MVNRIITYLAYKIYQVCFFFLKKNKNKKKHPIFLNFRKERKSHKFHIPGHGNWYQNYYLLHKVLVLVEVFPQGMQDHYRREKLGQLGGEYDGGGGGVENGGHAAESNLCVDVLMHGDSVKTLHMASAGDSRKVTLALQEGHFPLQHQMQLSSSHLVTEKKCIEKSNDQISLCNKQVLCINK